MSHPLRSRRRPAVGAPAWPSFRGVAQQVGTSPSGRVTVYVDPNLGAPGLENGRSLLADADRIVAANDAVFGVAGGAVEVVVFALGGATDGTGGADHMGCDYQTGAAIEVDASFGAPERVAALFEAELSECSMGGNLCGVSTGEALSRRCAASVSNDALADFATAPDWAGAGMPNYVDKTYPSDQDGASIGCGMAFISWLVGKGAALADIARELVGLGAKGTFAEVFASITGQPKSQAWPQFQAAVRALPGGVTNDAPFG
ncbi:MAG TPA: hypothetical protein VGS12_05055 [Caulobacteraceae bacterium]|nr:hypothetical protein [Caulobacteraceae bacterium]